MLSSNHDCFLPNTASSCGGVVVSPQCKSVFFLPYLWEVPLSSSVSGFTAPSQNHAFTFPISSHKLLTYVSYNSHEQWNTGTKWFYNKFPCTKIFDFLYYLSHFARVTSALTVVGAKFSSGDQLLSPSLTHLLLCSPAPTLSFCQSYSC